MTVRTAMPRDASGAYVQVMRPLAGGAHTITIGAASARNSSAFDTNTRVLEIYSDTACYFQTGNSGITASSADHYLPAQRGRVYSIGGDQQAQHTHIAVIQASAGGTLWVSELE